jgi:hypothetical protein
MFWPKFIFAFLAVGAVAFAGESRTVKLRVTDSFTHLPVAGAEVFLAEEAGEKSFRKVGVTGAISFFPLELTNAAANYQVEIRAEGYDSHRSPRFSFAEGASFKDVALARFADFEGVIIAPTGQRAGGARYFLCTDLTQVSFMPDRTFFTRSRVPATTGPSGKFRLSPESTGHAILVSHDLGFALRPLAGWTNGGAIQLRPWARVAGRLMFNGAAATNQVIGLTPSSSLLNRTPAVFLDFNGHTDTNGYFCFSNVPPMQVTFSRKASIRRADGMSAWILANSQNLMAEPGDGREQLVDFRGREIEGVFELAGMKKGRPVEIGMAILTRKMEARPVEFSPRPEAIDLSQDSFAVFTRESLRFSGDVIPTGAYVVQAWVEDSSWRGELVVPEGHGRIDLGTALLTKVDAVAK